MKRQAAGNKHSMNFSMEITGYLFILPALLFWIIWFFIPAIRSFCLSFFKYNYAKPLGNHFIGFSNYIKLFHDSTFGSAFLHTLIIVGICVPTEIVCGFLLACLINMKIKGKGILRTIFYLPNIISSVAVATIFMYLFAKNGMLTLCFNLLGMDNVSWSADLRYALLLIIFMYIWQQLGFYMVIFLSGLQTIPREIYESALIDGANRFQKAVYITVPELRPVFLLASINSIINAFQIFDQIATIAGSGGQLGSPAGATNTLVTFFYTNSFRFGDVGYGSASVVVLFVIILLLTILQQRISGHEI